MKNVNIHNFFLFYIWEVHLFVLVTIILRKEFNGKQKCLQASPKREMICGRSSNVDTYVGETSLEGELSLV